MRGGGGVFFSNRELQNTNRSAKKYIKIKKVNFLMYGLPQGGCRYIFFTYSIKQSAESRIKIEPYRTLVC